MISSVATDKTMNCLNFNGKVVPTGLFCKSKELTLRGTLWQSSDQDFVYAFTYEGGSKFNPRQGNEDPTSHMAHLTPAPKKKGDTCNTVRTVPGACGHSSCCSSILPPPQTNKIDGMAPQPFPLKRTGFNVVKRVQELNDNRPVLSLPSFFSFSSQKRGLKSVMVCCDLGSPYHLHRSGDNLIFCFLQIQL